MAADTGFRFLEDLTMALAVAAGAGFIAARLRVNPIVGYIVAGMIIGPFTPGYVAQHGTVAELADLGLIFLLFSIGLGVSFGEMLSIGWQSIVATLAAIGALIAAVWFVLELVHVPDALELAILAAVSSTAIGIALLGEWQMIGRRSGTFVLAVLVVQDLIAVVLLVFAGSPSGALTFSSIAIPLLKAVGFVAVLLLLGGTVLHAMVKRLLQSASTEGLFPAFAALALIAASLAKLIGLPVEFGAFVAGAVISEAAGSRMVQSIIAPFRAVFIALFFVSIGMAIDPKILVANWLAVLELGLAFCVVRLLLWAVVGRIGGFPLRTALLIGCALVPLGEFNLVLADVGTGVGRVNDAERTLFIGVTFLSILLTMLASPLVARVSSTREEEPAGDVHGIVRASGPAVVIGYGRVGTTVAAVLRSLGVGVTVLDIDKVAVERARSEGLDAVAGSGADPLALDALLSDRTRVVIVATHSTDLNASIADRVGATSRATVVARAMRTSDVRMLEGRGVAAAIVPETEGALSLARAALSQLGVSETRIEQVLRRQRTTLSS